MYILGKNTWNHRIACKLFILDRNTWVQRTFNEATTQKILIYVKIPVAIVGVGLFTESSVGNPCL